MYSPFGIGGAHLFRRFMIGLLPVAVFAALVEERPVDFGAMELGTAGQLALPDEIPHQSLQPDPFEVEEKAQVELLPPQAMNVTPPQEDVAAPDQDQGIPPQVWISLGLMAASILAYLAVAVSGQKKKANVISALGSRRTISTRHK